MSSIAVPQSEIWLPEKRRFRLPKFEPWRLLRPLNMDGQFFPSQSMQFQGGPFKTPEVHPASTKLMLHMNGADGSTSFTDFSQSGHTVTAIGTAQVDTAQSKFGGGSLLLDGNSDWLSIPSSSDFDFGAGTFNMEAQFRFNALPTSGNWMCIASRGWTITDQKGWFWGIHNDAGSYNAHFYYSTTGNDGIQHISVALSGLATNTWYHGTVGRLGNFTVMRIEGYSAALQITTAQTIFASNQEVRIGCSADGWPFDGWIDEFRIATTRAQYMSPSITALPTAAYPYDNGYHDPGDEILYTDGTFTFRVPNYKTQLEIRLYGAGGGGGGAGTSGNSGSAGGNTTITSLSLAANGGGGGGGRTTSGTGSGGAGGTASGGDTNTTGEAGNTDASGDGGDAPGPNGGAGGVCGASNTGGTNGSAAGGGGGGGNYFNVRRGGGGGSGGYCTKTYSPGDLTPDTDLSVVIGNYGSGGSGTQYGGGGNWGKAYFIWS